MKGGKRDGAGRPSTGRLTQSIRISPEHRDAIRKNGGSKFVRELIDKFLETKKEQNQ